MPGFGRVPGTGVEWARAVRACPSGPVRRPPCRLRRSRHPVPPGRRGRGRRPDHHHPPRRRGDRQLLRGHRDAQQGRAAAERPAGAAALRHQPVRDRPGRARGRRAAGRRVRRGAELGLQERPGLVRAAARVADGRPEGRLPTRSSVPARTPATCSPRSARSRSRTRARPTPPRTTSSPRARSCSRSGSADHDVEVNPKYAVDLDTPGQVDTDLSVAVGSTAKDGLKAEPDPAYTSSLPGHLVCLD